MKIELSEADRAFMSPAEIEALTSEGAGEALGAKAESKADEAATEATETAAPEAQEPAETQAASGGDDAPKPDADEPSAEALEAVAADEATPRERATRYDAGDVAALKAERQTALDERKALRTERRAIEAKYASGDMEDDERTRQLDALDDRLESLSDKAEELVGAIARAETLAEANRQHQHDLQMRAIDALKVRARREGFDYDKDDKAPAQFDRSLQVLAADPDNANRDFAELVDEAHRMVMALRGIQPAAKSAPAAPAAPPKAEPKPREVPPTLSGMPQAGAAVVGDDLLQKLATLEGEEAELFMARLPAAQVEKLLRH